MLKESYDLLGCLLVERSALGRRFAGRVLSLFDYFSICLLGCSCMCFACHYCRIEFCPAIERLDETKIYPYVNARLTPRETRRYDLENSVYYPKIPTFIHGVLNCTQVPWHVSGNGVMHGK
jgi:hypothetical protein